jgi:tRNA nucleotidyltransferase (CCA-adding enzyme)
MQRSAAIARWEHFEHGADIGVRGIGPTPAEAFEQAAVALTAVVTNPAGVQLRQERRVQCEGPDLDGLLYEWLNSVIYEMSVEKLLFGHYEVTIDGGQLTATLIGEPVAAERHQPTVEIKGATYTELRVAQQPDGSWCAQCIVDV